VTVAVDSVRRAGLTSSDRDCGAVVTVFAYGRLGTDSDPLEGPNGFEGTAAVPAMQ
jgi:hypothetical protein